VRQVTKVVQLSHRALSSARLVAHVAAHDDGSVAVRLADYSPDTGYQHQLRDGRRNDDNGHGMDHEYYKSYLAIERRGGEDKSLKGTSYHWHDCAGPCPLVFVSGIHLNINNVLLPLIESRIKTTF
jgi:hypothetical protein